MNPNIRETVLIRAMAAGFVLGLFVLSAHAEGDASYSASADARYVDLDARGNRGSVQEYDGKVYSIGQGDVQVGGQGAAGLFDFQLKDIGSTEENGSVCADYKDVFKGSAMLGILHHRQSYQRTGVVANGVWIANPAEVFRVPLNADFTVRRTEADVNLAVFAPGNSAKWFSVQYWTAEKFGSMSARANRYQVGVANVDNTQQDVTIGLGSNVKDDGAVSVDITHSEFKDAAAVSSITWAASGIIKPLYSPTQANAGDMRFRYDVSKKLAMTGALTARQRENLSTRYKMNAFVGALNAVYKNSDKLSLTAKLYSRVVAIDENAAFRGYAVAAPIGDSHQIDKTTLKGTFELDYRILEKLFLKAGYKAELSHRRDAPTQIYQGMRYFRDGTFVLPGELDNVVAREDVKHIGSMSLQAELPLGIEAEASYKRLQANRPAFVNQPTWQDDANASVIVPLPRDVSLTVMGGYLKERNTMSKFSKYSSSRNTYRAGLDWAATNKIFLGIGGSYENIHYFTEGWFGSGSATFPGSTFHEGGMNNRQENSVADAGGRINLPLGFTVKGSGSYAWSRMQTPLHFMTTDNYIMNDYTPSDVRIARGSLTLEYTPSGYKSITARAGYRIDDWVDKTDTNNSGRASIAQLGLEAKF
ncbi:MAG: hypothetical protein WCU88_09535 [Elusimicrobiota bacterium]|jgi:hypothetical protein